MLMNKPEFQNAIRVNHRGFLTNSQKRFILTENSAGSDEFSVFLIDNVREIKVFEGKMTPTHEDGSTYYVGDFSAVTQNGDYFIAAGGVKSRQFVIYDGAYDICQRTMLSYFTYQRCGHPLGWNGTCHTEDGYVKETGETVDLRGGYHQSCDLRKSPGGVSIGVLGMLRFALKDASEWGKILVRDEARWALEYYVKTIQENGAMYNTLNDPLGWEGRIFYQSPAPSSAQWNTTSILALGYSYFKDEDAAFAQKCLDQALCSYDYMTGSARSKELYRHPDPYQRGMDPDFFYEQCRKGATADLAYQITASADLYRATKEPRFLERIRQSVPPVLDKLTDVYVLMLTDDGQKTVS
ncbi:MAG: glycoside hydrolase family 9 protein, partial [Clostridia bacterium]|nr:glycoside hydrolase family 9 protein [Clostridia bacterium]